MAQGFTLQSHVKTVLSLYEKQLRAGLEAVGEEAEGRVADITPVDTGRLKNSITHRVGSNENAVIVGSNVEYAPYVEFGTSRAKAQPYLSPGLQNNIDVYRKILIQYMR